jgi:hypothetical protein
MNTITKQFEHPLAEGYGLSAEDTHQRYADEFRSAEFARSLDRPTERSVPAISGKASLYALIVAMWGAITFGAVMAMVFSG